MIIRWLRSNPSNNPLLNFDALKGALTIAEQAISGPARLFKRTFAAGVITDPAALSGSEDDDWVRFEAAILCEFWLGNPKDFKAAERDYLSTARAKAFTAWRFECDNDGLILHERRKLVAEDSLWIGSAFQSRIACGISGQLPAEDLFLARMIISSYLSLALLKLNRRRFSTLNPLIDTIGGQSFNYLPDFSIFD